MTEGSRRQVFNGTAERTSGGLTKKDLRLNKWGRIVSKAASKRAKKENRLEKNGFFAKKGEFGVIHKEACKGKSEKKCKSTTGCKYVHGKTRKYCKTAKKM